MSLVSHTIHGGDPPYTNTGLADPHTDAPTCSLVTLVHTLDTPVHTMYTPVHTLALGTPGLIKMNMNTGTNSSDSDSDISITDSEDEEIENSDSKVDTAEGGLCGISSGNAAEGHDDADDEDDLIKAIRHEKEKPRDQPPDIQCEDFVVDISFHPSENIIAAATITGDVIL
uniref:Uncharacterized protein n=1 Tax=Timema monikensis TaxID=170555 RepID=A0A7R9EHV5_9NEOP|nr:unnamed protein product [Timema monikensis]